MSDNNPPLAPVLDYLHVKYRHIPGNQTVCCPVHGERRPSCTVNLSEGWFRCHSCGAKGDTYQLIVEMESCDFPTAKSIVERLTGTQDSHLPGSNRQGSRRLSTVKRDRKGSGGRLSVGAREGTTAGRRTFSRQDRDT